MAKPPRISIIIPCLNEATEIGRQLDFLSTHRGDCEIIVVDGGSSDATIQIVASHTWCTLVQSPKAEKAYQMNSGASIASGDVLLFLHADTALPQDFQRLIDRALSENTAVGGAFYIAFDLDHWFLRFVTFLSKQNIRWITFGDHAMFFRRSIFDQLGGFPSMPILEDLEFQLRARKIGTMTRVPAPVVTSARRFVNNGIFRQTVIDAYILFGYYLGIPPKKLARTYSDDASAAR